jgi:hypothetical protein
MMYELNWQKYTVFRWSCIMPLEASKLANAKIGKLTALYVVHTPHFSHEVKTKLLPILELK